MHSESPRTQGPTSDDGGVPIGIAAGSSPTARGTIAAAVFGGVLGALGLALLTLRLNSAAAADSATSLPLVLFFVATGALLGVILGGLAVALAHLWVHVCVPLCGALARHLLPPRLMAALQSFCQSIQGARILSLLLAFSPIAYVLLLPEVGLTGSFLSDRIAAGRIELLLTLVILAVLLAALGLLLRAWGEARSLGPRMMAVSAGAVALLIVGLASAPEPPSTSPDSALPEPLAEVQPGAMVALLCVDGADQRVLDRLIDRGELPAFAELRRRGTQAALASFSPTLSPAIWTTMITGRRPEEHGIFGFTRFRLPGLREPLDRFPVHAGLNFQLPRLIESLPGAPAPRLPYTRFDRDAPTLWQIQEYMSRGQARAGVFRWRVTWPAEKMKGFMVAARVTLGEVKGAIRAHDPRLVYSRPAIMRQVEKARALAPRASEAEALPYLADGAAPPLDDGRWTMILRSLDYKPLFELSRLIERRQPRLVVAGFYSVDAFNHMFWRDARDGGVFAPAIEQRYRFTDARLADLMEKLPRDVNLIVVSDHGFDFQHGHHTHAPPGIFLAAGPAFESGRTVEGATVYDIAPLVLRLLGLPPARDMPGSTSYRELLSPTFDSATSTGGSAELVPSYQGLMTRIDRETRRPVDGEAPEVLEELEALGYIE